MATGCDEKAARVAQTNTAAASDAQIAETTGSAGSKVAVPVDPARAGGRFADAVPPEEVARRVAADRAGVRRKNILLAAALVVAVLLTMCQGVSAAGVLYSPADVAACLAGWFHLNVVALFRPAALLDQGAILAAHPMYHEVVARAGYTLVTVVCGAMLACSGMLYQNVFRNPIAAPTMLGVGSGVSAGLVALVVIYGTQAPYLTAYRYAYCFAGGLAVLVLVVGLGRLASGRRGLDLVDMLLVGTILSSLIGSVTGYITNYRFTDAQWLAYYDLLNAMDLDVGPLTMGVLAASALLSFAPVAALRFRMNGLAFPDADMRMLGVRTAGLRFLALACGSLMILAATALTGAVSMVSLVVPFAARAIFGPEFGKQLLGNVLIGALVLVVCRAIAVLVPFLGTGLPLGTTVTLVTLPAFVWVMTLAQRQWVDR